MCCISEKCEDCKRYDDGGCYYGPRVIVKIVGPILQMVGVIALSKKQDKRIYNGITN